MFTRRTMPFKTAEVITFLNVLLACVLLPLATSDDRLAEFAGHAGPTRRSPNLLLKVPEGSRVRLAESLNIPQRRSLSHEKNTDDVVSPRMLAPSLNRVNYRRSNVNANVNRHQNYNMNMNVIKGRGGMKRKDKSRLLGTNEGKMTLRSGMGVDNLEAKLYACVIFRANMMVVFGKILIAPNNGLTVDQYSSLNLIQQALIHKQVYVFDMLPILKKLANVDLKERIKMVMQGLANNVPEYLACVCKYWENQIDENLVDIEEITGSLGQSANFLARLNSDLIDSIQINDAEEEMKPFDKASQVTKETLGPVFVNIFYKLKNRQMTLTPKIFGAILINLPVGKLNPVLEEYIDFVWYVMRTNAPSNWNEVALGIEYGTPYEIVKSAIKKLLEEGNIPSVVERVLIYILLHLKEVPNTFSNEYYPDMVMLLNDGSNLELMFSMIQDDAAYPELGDLRYLMIDYVKQKKVDANFRSMNKYNYERPIDILIGLLARIQARTQDKDIRETVTKILSILILKEELGSFRTTVSADVDLPMLLNFHNASNSDTDIPDLGQKVQKYLDANLDLLIIFQEVMLKEKKSKCQRPMQCLEGLFRTVVDSESIPKLEENSDLMEMIRKLLVLIRITVNDSAQCKSDDATCEEHEEHPETVDNSMDDESDPGSTDQLPGPESTSLPFVYIPSDSDEDTSTLDHPNMFGLDLVNEMFDMDDSSSSTASDEDVSDLDVWKKPVDGVPKSREPERTSTSVPEHSQPVKIPASQSIPQVVPSSEPAPLATTSPFGVKEPPAEQEVNNSSPQTEYEPFLPPNLSYDKKMYVVFPQDGGPPYKSSRKPSNSDSVVEFPPIEILLQEFDPNTPFSDYELPDVPEIFGPLKRIVGLNFFEEILGKPVDKNEYPTVISLMDDLLEHALENPKVMADPDLIRSIRLYLRGIDYITTSALFPVIVDSLKVSSDVLHVTFDPDNPNENSVDSEPPLRTEAGFMTLSIYHPKFWVQPVDPHDPYGTLVPSQESAENDPIQNFIKDGSLQKILGPDFDPFLYPDKGTLLTTVLQRLTASERVKSDLRLTKTLKWYLKSIRTVAMYNKVPSNHFTQLREKQRSNAFNWQPDTTSLIIALPAPNNQDEFKKIDLIKALLKMPNLIELLGIKNRISYSTTRGELLKLIFEAAIQGDKIVLDSQTSAALKYYVGKILMSGLGALPVTWTLVHMFIIREEVPLGEIIEAVIDYDRLHRKLKNTYNDLMMYLSRNPQFLQGNEDFDFHKYPTKGTFLKGLFNHFLKKPGVSPQAKKSMRQLIPHIMLKGRGVESMNHVTIDDIENGKIVRSGLSSLRNG